MTRFPKYAAFIAFLTVWGCGSSDKDDTAGGADGTTEATTETTGGILPQAGDWAIVTSGWANDDCNAENNLLTPTSIRFADVESTSFRNTYFDSQGQVGNTILCSHESGDSYLCEGFTNGFSYTDVDASISVTGVGVVLMTSETTASGSGDFVLECSGSDCGQVAGITNSGMFPCGTTLNWTAQAN